MSDVATSRSSHHLGAKTKPGCVIARSMTRRVSYRGALLEHTVPRRDRDLQRRELRRRPMAAGMPDEGLEHVRVHRSDGADPPLHQLRWYRTKADLLAGIELVIAIATIVGNGIAIPSRERAPLEIHQLVAPHGLRAFAPERDRFRRRRDHPGVSVRDAGRRRSERKRRPPRMVIAGPPREAPRAGRGPDVLCLEPGHRGGAPNFCAPGPRITGCLTR